jgi:hypothetical protein
MVKETNINQNVLSAIYRNILYFKEVSYEKISVSVFIRFSFFRLCRPRPVGGSRRGDRRASRMVGY